MKAKNGFLSKHPYLPFVFLFLFMLVRHAVTQTGTGDDSWFLAESKKGLWNFTITRIQTWSSRNLIEAVLLILLNCNRWFWNILDSLMFVLCAYSAEKISFTGARKTCVMHCSDYSSIYLISI